jgi:hypothetical protein
MHRVCYLVFSVVAASSAAAPFDSPIQNQNDVDGVPLGKSTGSIKYLGKCNSVAECESLCKGVPDDACQSYTWHASTLTDGYETMCYGRTDRRWSLVSAKGHISAKRSSLVPSPFDVPIQNANNVDNVPLGKSSGSIKYLGKSNSTAECEILCQGVPGDACLSYTWHTSTLTDGYANMCYGRTDTVWAPISMDGHISAKRSSLVPSAPCTSTAGCNNGGYCAFPVGAAAGTCVCDPTWRGATCCELSLLPAKSVGNGLHNLTANTWGESTAL